MLCLHSAVFQGIDDLRGESFYEEKITGCFLTVWAEGQLSWPLRILPQ